MCNKQTDSRQTWVWNNTAVNYSLKPMDFALPANICANCQHHLHRNKSAGKKKHAIYAMEPKDMVDFSIRHFTQALQEVPQDVAKRLRCLFGEGMCRFCISGSVFQHVSTMKGAFLTKGRSIGKCVTKIYQGFWFHSEVRLLSFGASHASEHASVLLSWPKASQNCPIPCLKRSTFQTPPDFWPNI